MKSICLSFTILCFGFLTSCQHHAADSGASIPHQYTPQEFTELWNRSNMPANLDTLEMLYADTVEFYGTVITKTNCIEKKVDFLKKHPRFIQWIDQYQRTEKIDKLTTKCYFIKRTVLDSVQQDYRSYLVLQKINDQWKIIVEGDETTDRNIKFRQPDANEIPEDAIEGDFDGDGKKEYLWVVSPEVVDMYNCTGGCDCFLRTSLSGIPLAKIQDCIGGSLINYGDLNGDGGDEVGISPSWFTSCWGRYFVYTLRNHKLIYAVDPFTLYCSSWNDTAIIRKDPNIKGHAIITYYDMDSDFRTLHKSVPFH